MALTGRKGLTQRSTFALIGETKQLPHHVLHRLFFDFDVYKKGKKTMLLVETTTAKTSNNWQNLMSYPTSRECEDHVFCWMQFYHKNCLVSNCQSKAQWILSPQNYITASSSWDKQYIYQLGNTKIKHLLYTILKPHRQVICNNLWNTCLNINTT